MDDRSRPTFEELSVLASGLGTAPRDQGTLELIVLRLPGEGRATPSHVSASPEEGLQGDRWALSPNRKPDAQVSLMNLRVARAVAGGVERVPLAGDNLIVDLDLSQDNLPPGSLLRVGEALLEVSALAHTGCEKFKRRFGEDALRLVNLEECRARRLRGVYARVLEGGRICVGDAVRKIRRVREGNGEDVRLPDLR